MVTLLSSVNVSSGPSYFICQSIVYCCTSVLRKLIALYNMRVSNRQRGGSIRVSDAKASKSSSRPRHLPTTHRKNLAHTFSSKPANIYRESASPTIIKSEKETTRQRYLYLSNSKYRHFDVLLTDRPIPSVTPTLIS
jgi:hypothetical protein